MLANCGIAAANYLFVLWDGKNFEGREVSAKVAPVQGYQAIGLFERVGPDQEVGYQVAAGAAMPAIVLENLTCEEGACRPYRVEFDTQGFQPRFECAAILKKRRQFGIYDIAEYQTGLRAGLNQDMDPRFRIALALENAP
jgi:hypothetical protein